MAMSAPLALPAFAALPALFAPVVLMTFPPDTVIRPARLADGAVVAYLRYALWPDASVHAHAREIDAILQNKASSLPQVIFVAEAADHTIAGFAEVGLRSHADGCDPLNPVGFLEGLYVVPDRRSGGIGRSLLAAAENWARSQGCKEMASDTWIDNEGSQKLHETLGYEVIDRCVHYRKTL
jgi:aminoglycoside 6'-N-acetyltransferase I